MVNQIRRCPSSAPHLPRNTHNFPDICFIPNSIQPLPDLSLSLRSMSSTSPISHAHVTTTSIIPPQNVVTSPITNTVQTNPDHSVVDFSKGASSTPPQFKVPTILQHLFPTQSFLMTLCTAAKTADFNTFYTTFRTHIDNILAVGIPYQTCTAFWSTFAFPIPIPVAQPLYQIIQHKKTFTLLECVIIICESDIVKATLALYLIQMGISPFVSFYESPQQSHILPQSQPHHSLQLNDCMIRPSTQFSTQSTQHDEIEKTTLAYASSSRLSSASTFPWETTTASVSSLHHHKIATQSHFTTSGESSQISSPSRQQSHHTASTSTSTSSVIGFKAPIININSVSHHPSRPPAVQIASIPLHEHQPTFTPTTTTTLHEAPSISTFSQSHQSFHTTTTTGGDITNFDDSHFSSMFSSADHTHDPVQNTSPCDIIRMWFQNSPRSDTPFARRVVSTFHASSHMRSLPLSDSISLSTQSLSTSLLPSQHHNPLAPFHRELSSTDSLSFLSQLTFKTPIPMNSFSSLSRKHIHQYFVMSGMLSNTSTIAQLLHLLLPPFAFMPSSQATSATATSCAAAAAAAACAAAATVPSCPAATGSSDAPSRPLCIPPIVSSILSYQCSLDTVPELMDLTQPSAAATAAASSDKSCDKLPSSPLLAAVWGSKTLFSWSACIHAKLQASITKCQSESTTTPVVSSPEGAPTATDNTHAIASSSSPPTTQPSAPHRDLTAHIFPSLSFNSATGQTLLHSLAQQADFAALHQLLLASAAFCNTMYKVALCAQYVSHQQTSQQTTNSARHGNIPSSAAKQQHIDDDDDDDDNDDDDDDDDNDDPETDDTATLELSSSFSSASSDSNDVQRFRLGHEIDDKSAPSLPSNDPATLQAAIEPYLPAPAHHLRLLPSMRDRQGYDPLVHLLLGASLASTSSKSPSPGSVVPGIQHIIPCFRLFLQVTGFSLLFPINIKSTSTILNSIHSHQFNPLSQPRPSRKLLDQRIALTRQLNFYPRFVIQQTTTVLGGNTDSISETLSQGGRNSISLQSSPSLLPSSTTSSSSPRQYTTLLHILLDHISSTSNVSLGLFAAVLHEIRLYIQHTMQFTQVETVQNDNTTEESEANNNNTNNNTTANDKTTSQIFSCHHDLPSFSLLTLMRTWLWLPVAMEDNDTMPSSSTASSSSPTSTTSALNPPSFCLDVDDAASIRLQPLLLAEHTLSTTNHSYPPILSAQDQSDLLSNMALDFLQIDQSNLSLSSTSTTDTPTKHLVPPSLESCRSNTPSLQSPPKSTDNTQLTPLTAVTLAQVLLPSSLITTTGGGSDSPQSTKTSQFVEASGYTSPYQRVVQMVDLPLAQRNMVIDAIAQLDEAICHSMQQIIQIEQAVQQRLPSAPSNTVASTISTSTSETNNNTTETPGAKRGLFASFIAAWSGSCEADRERAHAKRVARFQEAATGTDYCCRITRQFLRQKIEACKQREQRQLRRLQKAQTYEHTTRFGRTLHEHLHSHYIAHLESDLSRTRRKLASMLELVPPDMDLGLSNTTSTSTSQTPTSSTVRLLQSTSTADDSGDHHDHHGPDSESMYDFENDVAVRSLDNVLQKSHSPSWFTTLWSGAADYYIHNYRIYDLYCDIIAQVFQHLHDTYGEYMRNNMNNSNINDEPDTICSTAPSHKFQFFYSGLLMCNSSRDFMEKHATAFQTLRKRPLPVQLTMQILYDLHLAIQMLSTSFPLHPFGCHAVFQSIVLTLPRLWALLLGLPTPPSLRVAQCDRLLVTSDGSSRTVHYRDSVKLPTDFLPVCWPVKYIKIQKTIQSMHLPQLQQLLSRIVVSSSNYEPLHQDTVSSSAAEKPTTTTAPKSTDDQVTYSELGSPSLFFSVAVLLNLSSFPHTPNPPEPSAEQLSMILLPPKCRNLIAIAPPALTSNSRNFVVSSSRPTLPGCCPCQQPCDPHPQVNVSRHHHALKMCPVLAAAAAAAAAATGTSPVSAAAASPFLSSPRPVTFSQDQFLYQPLPEQHSTRLTQRHFQDIPSSSVVTSGPHPVIDPSRISTVSALLAPQLPSPAHSHHGHYDSQFRHSMHIQSSISRPIVIEPLFKDASLHPTQCPIPGTAGTATTTTAGSVKTSMVPTVRNWHQTTPFPPHHHEDDEDRTSGLLPHNNVQPVALTDILDAPLSVASTWLNTLSDDHSPFVMQSLYPLAQAQTCAPLSRWEASWKQFAVANTAVIVAPSQPVEPPQSAEAELLDSYSHDEGQDRILQHGSSTGHRSADSDDTKSPYSRQVWTPMPLLSVPTCSPQLVALNHSSGSGSRLATTEGGSILVPDMTETSGGRHSGDGSVDSGWNDQEERHSHSSLPTLSLSPNHNSTLVTNQSDKNIMDHDGDEFRPSQSIPPAVTRHSASASPLVRIPQPLRLKPLASTDPLCVADISETSQAQLLQSRWGMSSHLDKVMTHPCSTLPTGQRCFLPHSDAFSDDALQRGLSHLKNQNKTTSQMISEAYSHRSQDWDTTQAHLLQFQHRSPPVSATQQHHSMDFPLYMPELIPSSAPMSPATTSVPAAAAATTTEAALPRPQEELFPESVQCPYAAINTCDDEAVVSATESPAQGRLPPPLPVDLAQPIMQYFLPHSHHSLQSVGWFDKRLQCSNETNPYLFAISSNPIKQWKLPQLRHEWYLWKCMMTIPQRPRPFPSALRWIGARAHEMAFQQYVLNITMHKRFLRQIEKKTRQDQQMARRHHQLLLKRQELHQQQHGSIATNVTTACATTCATVTTTTTTTSTCQSMPCTMTTQDDKLTFPSSSTSQVQNTAPFNVQQRMVNPLTKQQQSGSSTFSVDRCNNRNNNLGSSQYDYVTEASNAPNRNAAPYRTRTAPFRPERMRPTPLFFPPQPPAGFEQPTVNHNTPEMKPLHSNWAHLRQQQQPQPQQQQQYQAPPQQPLQQQLPPPPQQQQRPSRRPQMLCVSPVTSSQPPLVGSGGDWCLEQSFHDPYKTSACSTVQTPTAANAIHKSRSHHTQHRRHQPSQQQMNQSQTR